MAVSVKHWVLFVPLTALFVACHAPTRSTEHVDTALLRHVDEEGRQAVADARRVRDEAGDAIAAARLDVQKAKAELEIARQERDVAVARLQRAQNDNGTVVRAADASDRIIMDARVDPNVREARLGVACADDRIIWRKCTVEAEERHVDVLEARQALAEARVQQAKCSALMRAGRPEVDMLAMDEIDRTVRRCEPEITVTETRLVWAQKEVDLARSRAEESIETRRESVKGSEERAAGVRRTEAEREAEAARKAAEPGKLPQ